MATVQTVDKKVLRNLKKLFTSRDNDLINQGHEVLRSLGDADICNYFLDGVKYTPQNDSGLVPNSIVYWNGSCFEKRCEKLNYIKKVIL